MKLTRVTITGADEGVAPAELRKVSYSEENETLRNRLNELEGVLNSPVTADFLDGVRNEAAHQVGRWGTEHDAGKTPQDWFWLIGYLAGKALAAAIRGDLPKAKHHTISSAAALLNWHRQLSGESNAMRPGIAPPAELAEVAGG